jgi:hypothetical protein
METISLEELINLLSNDGYDPYAKLTYTRKGTTYEIDNTDNFNWYIKELVEHKMNTYKLDKLVMFLKSETKFFKHIPWDNKIFIKNIDPIHLTMINRELIDKEFTTRTLIKEYCKKVFTPITALDYLKEHDPTLEISVSLMDAKNEHILNVTSVDLADVLFKHKLELEVDKALESYNWE